MNPFEYNASPARIVFGNGIIDKLPKELSRLGVSNPLVLSTPHQVNHAEMISEILQGKVAGVFSEAQMHTPTSLTERACAEAISSKTDCLVSIGGGSTIGLGKAISIRLDIPHIAIPTTYAGSEATPILGETTEGRKETRSNPKILPNVILYDVELTLSLPIGLTATSGINAIAHAVEALYAQNSNPIISLLAVEGVKALATALPKLVQSPLDQTARSHALYGAWLCGTCLGNVGMSLHHKLCHTLGGSFNLPHAETHTIILPHALAYNAPKVPEAVTLLATAFPNSGGDSIKGLNGLLAQIKVERGLKALGMQESDIDKAADVAVSKPYWNPRVIEREAIRELIRRAWAGEDARLDL